MGLGQRVCKSTVRFAIGGCCSESPRGVKDLWQGYKTHALVQVLVKDRQVTRLSVCGSKKCHNWDLNCWLFRFDDMPLCLRIVSVQDLAAPIYKRGEKDTLDGQIACDISFIPSGALITKWDMFNNCQDIKHKLGWLQKSWGAMSFSALGKGERKEMNRFKQSGLCAALSVF